MGILRLLMVNKGNIIPRDAIIDELWQSEQFIDENTLNVNIVRLRKTLAEIGLPDYLETKRGLGYCVWIHEIKTPITSARLMIENEKNPTTLRIDDELRKIDTYVEQVLYYARSTDVEKDFKVEKTTLQSLVHAALKTYSKPLIQAGGKPVAHL